MYKPTKSNIETVIFLPCSKVDLDVNKDHDAGWDVEGAKGGVHHVTRVTAQLRGGGRNKIVNVRENNFNPTP